MPDGEVTTTTTTPWYQGVPGVDALMDLIAQDKKVKRGKLTFILVRGIGQVKVGNVVLTDGKVFKAARSLGPRRWQRLGQPAPRAGTWV